MRGINPQHASGMGIFTRLRRANAVAASAAPAPSAVGGTGIASPLTSTPSHLESVVWSELLGVLDPERLPLTRERAMTVPAVARARNVIAPAVGRLPLIAYRGDQPATDWQSVLDQPERRPARPRYITMTWVVDALLFYGRAWLVVAERRAEDNRPKSFEWVPEWTARLDNTGQLVGTNDGRKIAAADVVRIDGPHEGILTYGGDTIRQALRLDAAALRIADNPVPAIELHQTTPDELTADERKTLVAEWIKARRQSGVGYTSAAIDARVHGINPEQLVIAGRSFSALQCARMMGVPAWVCDVSVEGSALTYTNVPSRARELVDYALAPYLEAIAARLSMDDVLPRGIWCAFDTDALTVPDFGDRMTAYKTAVDSRVYTPEELRAREGIKPRESEDNA